MTDQKKVCDIGPSWCTLLHDAERWSREMADFAKTQMKGPIIASVWAYRIDEIEMLAVDMKGSFGKDLSITFGTGNTQETQYDFDNLAENSCFETPDMTEALTLTSLLLKKLNATVTMSVFG